VCCQLLDQGYQPAPEELHFALLKAAALGEARVVTTLLDTGVHDALQADGRTQLHSAVGIAFCVAAEKTHAEVVRVMLDRQVVSGHLQSALMGAAGAPLGSQVVKLLLEAGAAASGGQVGFDANLTPLGVAISDSGDTMTVQLLLEHGARVDKAPYSTGHSQLSERGILFHAAVSCEGPDIMRLLIRHGARQGLHDAMHQATKDGKWDMLQVLVQASTGAVQ
jgi:hypothetical protein